MSKQLPSDAGITQLIQTYLEGLHNPSEDGLYNELRAMRDTENLKAAIIAWRDAAIVAELERMEDVMDGDEGPDRFKYHYAGEDGEVYRPLEYIADRINELKGTTNGK